MSYIACCKVMAEKSSTTEYHHELKPGERCPECREYSPKCERCQHRADSRQQCREFLAIHPDGKGMINDPAPRVECKDHEFYGLKIRDYPACDDFMMAR